MPRSRHRHRLVPNLKLRILLSYLVLSAAFLAASVVSYLGSMRTLRSQVDQPFSRITEQTAGQIAERFDEMVGMSEIMLYNKSDHELLKNAGKSYIEQFVDYLRIRQSIESFLSFYSDYSMRIHLKQDGLITAEQRTFFPERLLRERGIYEEVVKSGAALSWIGPLQVMDGNNNPYSGLSLFRTLYDISSTMHERTGTIEIVMPMESIEQILRYGTVDGSIALLVDRDWRHVAGTRPLSEVDGFLLQEPTGNTGAPQAARIDARDYSLYSVEVPINGWRVATLVPMAALTREILLANRRFALFLVAFALLTALVAAASTRSLTRRVSVIKNVLLETESSNFSQTIDIRWADELAVVERHINQFIRRISRMIREVSESHDAQRRAEIAALQAQLNPHFLYNTLDAINWMAIDSNQMRISDIITKLGSFLRIGLGSTESGFVTVEEELRHVQLFVNIHQIRMSNLLDVHYDVDSDVLGCAILKLLLQPVVENSILHGFPDGKSTSGHLSVIGRLSGAHVEIVVRDNGVGFEALGDPAPQMDLSGRTSHYGIKNVRERLHLYYGDQGSMQIHSRPGMGTTVTIRFPKSSG